MAALADRLRIQVDPALAEDLAWRALNAASSRGDHAPLEEHHRRASRIYELADAGLRAGLFRELAGQEVIELGLVAPIIEALAERPALAQAVDRILVRPSGGAAVAGVTCDRSGRRLGLTVPPPLFDEPDQVLAWTRHGLGHAADTADPDFGFRPGLEASLGAAALERLHTLWDVSVDGRASAGGLSTRGVTESSYVTRVAALLGADPGRLAARLVARLWDGPRPGFPELLDLALNPARVQDWLGPVDPDAPAMGTAPAAVRTTAGTAPDRLPGGRCPLCQCASAELRRPEPGPAAAIHREYPAIDPALGVCERCLDRVLLVPTLGGMS